MLVAGAPPALAAGTTISTRTTGLGLIVVGKDRHTVYLFTKDGRNSSTCGPTCRQTWHRVKTDGPPRAGDGIKKSHLGQTAHHQVTYYGHPLYYYVGDAKAGQTRGQGMRSFGGRWWVVSPQGKVGTGATIALHSTPDGNAVAGAHGRTLYLLTRDSRTTSTCRAGCVGTWPPLITTGRPHAGTGTSADLLRTLVRPNGTRQVVYNGHPLYYYAGDSSAGQDYGQCLPQYPGTWYIVDGAGHAVTAGCGAAAASAGRSARTAPRGSA